MFYFLVFYVAVGILSAIQFIISSRMIRMKTRTILMFVVLMIFFYPIVFYFAYTEKDYYSKKDTEEQFQDLVDQIERG